MRDLVMCPKKLEVVRINCKNCANFALLYDNLSRPAGYPLIPAGAHKPVSGR